jgi:hypothetical protein
MRSIFYVVHQFLLYEQFQKKDGARFYLRVKKGSIAQIRNQIKFLKTNFSVELQNQILSKSAQ